MVNCFTATVVLLRYRHYRHVVYDVTYYTSSHALQENLGYSGLCEHASRVFIFASTSI